MINEEKEVLTSVEEVDPEEEIRQKIQARVEADALKRAQKFIKKNRTEIKRLRRHAEEALFRGNKVQYVYAVKKLRDMLKQPYTEDFIDTMWNTSLASIRNIVASQQKH